MKYLLYIILTTFLFSSISNAQIIDDSARINVEYEQLYSFNSPDERAIALGLNGNVLTEYSSGWLRCRVNYTLYNHLDSLKSKNVGTRYCSEYPYLQVNMSRCGRYLFYEFVENSLKGIDVYDTVLDTTIAINRPDGDIFRIEIFDLNHILFIVKPVKEVYQQYQQSGRLEVYLRRNNKDKFICHGNSAIWSPNGKWFFVRKYK
jgi:hypothetical protein